MLLWNVVCAHFDVIDKDVGEVCSSGEIIRQLHVTINDELDMMCSWSKLQKCGVVSGSRTKVYVSA